MCNLLSYGRKIKNFFNKFKEPSATGLCDFTWNDPVEGIERYASEITTLLDGKCKERGEKSSKYEVPYDGCDV